MLCKMTTWWARSPRRLPNSRPNGERQAADLFRQCRDDAEAAQVDRALTHYYEHDNANVHRGLHELSSRATDAYEAARAPKVARSPSSGEPEEIVFTRGTTEADQSVAQALGWAI